MKLIYKILCCLVLCGSINTTKAQCWQSINGGWAHSLALEQNGTLWTWGVNSNGELGDGTNTNNNTFTQIGIATNWKKISGGWAHSVAIKQDGTLWSWGGNTYGQLGDGANTDKNMPAPIGIATDWQNITAGHGDHCLAIKQDGTLWAWGDNSSGQLGDGTNSNKNIPTQIGIATNWKSISGGGFHSLAIKQDGTLWAWGDNSSGQLGDGTNANKNIPTQIGIATDWRSISCGRGHSLAIKQDGTLWAWGDNFYGGLGDGSNISKNIPTQIGIGTDWQSMSAGGFHSIAIKQDGTLWACGYNLDGELGDGTNINKNTFVQIGIASVWQNFSGGGLHNLFIKQDGTLWACGFNIFGQLGDGTNTDQNTPIQIGGSCSTLSIKLESFTASLQNSNTVKLQWKIATAEEGGKYELQRSTDSYNFSIINLQTGNSSLTQFNYTDNSLSNGTYYYRLRMIDKDGKVTHSNVAILKIGNKDQSLSIYPNPVKKGESLQLSLQNIIADKIEIISSAGQIVYSNAAKQTGSLGIPVPSSLGAGQYIIRIISENKVVTQKLLIQ